MSATTTKITQSDFDQCVRDLDYQRHFRDSMKVFLQYAKREDAPSFVSYFQQKLEDARRRANRVWARRTRLARRLKSEGQSQNKSSRLGPDRLTSLSGRTPTAPEPTVPH